MKDHDQDWCYTEVDSDGVGVPGRWGNCNQGCRSKLQNSSLTHGKCTRVKYSLTLQKINNIHKIYYTNSIFQEHPERNVEFSDLFCALGTILRM